MRNRARCRHAGAAAVLLAFLAGSMTAAHADLSKGVQKAMKGQLIVTAEELAMPAGEDKAVIAALKKAGVKAVSGYRGGEGSNAWTFHFIAFMKKAPGKGEVSLDFYTDDKEKLYVANKRLSGLDPKLALVASKVDISEEDGVKKGGRYMVKLSAEIGGKDTVLAETKLTLK
jgi:hypothetical protein